MLKQIDGCEAGSKTDTKSLLWENNTTKIDIPAKYGSVYFYFAFSQQEPSRTDGWIHCGIANARVNTFNSWISTEQALVSPGSRLQDALCKGQFMVHMEIITEFGHRVCKDFIIKVGDGWRNLDAEMHKCQCFPPSKWRRFVNFFLRRQAKP